MKLSPHQTGRMPARHFSDVSDLVLLDLMIPKRNGMEVMGRIRESSTVPIIILSAKDTDSDKTLGLGLGADDYITKPFSVTEVLARIKAALRRTNQYDAGAIRQQPVLTRGKLTMDVNTYSVKKDGKEIELTAKEFEILKLLLQNPKKVYTKEQIYSLVWNDAFVIDFDMGSLSVYLQLILKSFVTVSMSFIALFAGMAMKSSKAVIVTSFLLIFLTQANVGDFTMADHAAVPLVLTAVSFGFAVLSICNAEKKDLG